MAIGLTKRQADALRFICGFVEAHGKAPTRDEIADGLGLCFKGDVQRSLHGLEERGHIKLTSARKRNIEIIEPLAIPRSDTGEPLRFIPVLSYGEEAHG